MGLHDPTSYDGFSSACSFKTRKLKIYISNTILFHRSCFNIPGEIFHLYEENFSFRVQYLKYRRQFTNLRNVFDKLMKYQIEYYVGGIVWLGAYSLFSPRCSQLPVSSLRDGMRIIVLNRYVIFYSE